MDKLIYLVIIPVLVYITVRLIDKHYTVGGSRLLLAAACVLFGVSIFLPSPVIDGESTEFLTHVFGGGVFTGLLWLYFQSHIKTRPWRVELLTLFALVSSLGVINELFELVMHVLGFNPKSIADTSWDLLANTVGVFLFYATYRLIKYLKPLFLQR